MRSLILDEHRNLFKDQESFDQFLQILATNLGQDSSLVLSGGRVLGTVLSPEATKEILYERMIRGISKSPEVLDEIRDRIENDEIVD